MHINLRRTGTSRRQLWFYRWGFGFWLGRMMFNVGHDTRSRFVSSEPGPTGGEK